MDGDQIFGTANDDATFVSFCYSSCSHTKISIFDPGQNISLPGSDLNMLFQLRSPLTPSGSLMLTLISEGTCMIILAMVAMCL
jgi:hypothetical protein